MIQFSADTAKRIAFAVTKANYSLHLRYSKLTGTKNAELSVAQLNGNPRSDSGVTISGFPAVIDETNGDLIYNEVPAATTHIVFNYDPKSVTGGTVTLDINGLDEVENG
jgi:hypothetical protein